MNTTPTRSLSSIMDGNSFQATNLGLLPSNEQALIRRRMAALGTSYRLFYRTPVHADRAEGCYLFTPDGTRYLDAYNNVASVGHANQRVIDAVGLQMGKLNTHTRYLQDGIVEHSEQLLATFPEYLNSVMYTNSGSEANDLAIRVARLWTGGEGLVVTAEAYHGTTELLSRVSPAISGGFPEDPSVRVIAAPDTYRVETNDMGAWFAAQVREAFEDLLAHGIKPAAFLADSIFSSDGIFPNPVGYLRPAIEVCHEYGALFIADEVQPGFGRTGDTFWGFERHGVEADLVSMGKPMGNGIPVAALVGRTEILDRFGTEVPYFNTFGGNSVSIAAANAVLSFIQETGLQSQVATVGASLRDAISTITSDAAFVGDVRGSGLYIGVEIVTDRDSKSPDGGRALAIVNDLRDRGVLISVAGPGNNVLKIRPPLVFGTSEVALFSDRFADTIAAAGNA
ncbi:aspartate aminotransferase family protein [Demequina aurantiaca]|uniref:aspartate aminotransferase family protein n=1 Tax=Demequina aurantiaca TaxID=676200 RepID=UPI003D33451D